MACKNLQVSQCQSEDRGKDVRARNHFSAVSLVLCSCVVNNLEICSVVLNFAPCLHRSASFQASDVHFNS